MEIDKYIPIYTTHPFIFAYEKELVNNKKGKNKYAISEYIWNEIKDTHLYIKTKLSQYFNTDIPILYGGSANSENCSQIISIDNVGGLLVGGASLKKHDFKAICNC